MIRETRYKTASDAFDDLNVQIREHGQKFGDTLALFNVGFYIDNPDDMVIKSPDRKWSENYAESEWDWYMSADPSIHTLGKIHGSIPPIWKLMADKDGNVNSNYGYQWHRNDQLRKVTHMLGNKKDTRQATLSIYDGKEIDLYSTDTPCTYAIQFSIIDDKLCMSVYMRSNDLWYGFCNDQYQFAMLQKYVADELSIDVGWYYHHAHNMHLYNNKL